MAVFLVALTAHAQPIQLVASRDQLLTPPGAPYGRTMRRCGIHPSGLFVAMLALVVQLAFGAAVPDMRLPLALHQVAFICHAPAPGEGKAPPAQHHRVPLGAFCPQWMTAVAPGLLPAPAAPALPALVPTLFARAGLPPPQTAPPGIPFRLAQPRAPPALA